MKTTAAGVMIAAIAAVAMIAGGVWVMMNPRTAAGMNAAMKTAAAMMMYIDAITSMLSFCVRASRPFLMRFMLFSIRMFRRLVVCRFCASSRRLVSVLGFCRGL